MNCAHILSHSSAQNFHVKYYLINKPARPGLPLIVIVIVYECAIDLAKSTCSAIGQMQISITHASDISIQGLCLYVNSRACLTLIIEQYLLIMCVHTYLVICFFFFSLFLAKRRLEVS